MKIGKVLKVFYILSAIILIAGMFLPFAYLHYGFEMTPVTLFSGYIGKAICIISAVAILAMIIRYTRVIAFLTTALADGCAIVIWASWRDKLVTSIPVQTVSAVYTRGYGYYIFMAGAIMLLLFGILCFMFVEED